MSISQNFFCRRLWKSAFLKKFLLRKSFTSQILGVKDFLHKISSKMLIFKVVYRNSFWDIDTKNFVFAGCVVLHAKNFQIIATKIKTKKKKMSPTGIDPVTLRSSVTRLRDAIPWMERRSPNWAIATYLCSEGR